MTDTTRDLIQRLAGELDTWMMAHHHGGVPPEIQHAATLVAAARVYLAQPEPEGLTEEEIEEHFQRWWFDEGSGMRPFNGEDQEEHTRRVSQIAWSNGAYVARWSRPDVEPEPEYPSDQELLELMTDQHPLTDEMCENIAPTAQWAGDIGDTIFRHCDMRAAADWQLEQVLEWLKEKEYGQYHHDEIIYADDLRKAMRPTTTTTTETP